MEVFNLNLNESSKSSSVSQHYEYNSHFKLHILTFLKKKDENKK